MSQAAFLLAVAGLLLAGAPIATAQEPLRALAAAHDFHVGAAVAMGPFRDDEAYRETLKREFNAIVGENAFKWALIHPGRESYHFTDTDELVAFAEENGMMVRGHTLAWHSQNPPWLIAGNYSRDEAIAILRDHIATVVGRYKGRIAEWDVVNEAIDDQGRPRDTLWSQMIGPDYIEMAFRFAHEADPDAKLFYNDYNDEGMNAKADAIYALVKELKEKGVPIDGVGWQMHLVNGFRIGAENRENAQRLAALGLDISITELDVRTALPANAAALDRQAKAYGDVTGFCLSLPNCHTLMTWGFTDGSSWIPGFFGGYGDALPFDADYKPKPAYGAMHDALAAQ